MLRGVQACDQIKPGVYQDLCKKIDLLGKFENGDEFMRNFTDLDKIRAVYLPKISKGLDELQRKIEDQKKNLHTRKRQRNYLILLGVILNSIGILSAGYVSLYP